MGLTVIPGQCPPRRHGDVHRDSSGQPGLTRRTPDLPAPGTDVSQQRSQLNGHTTRDIRRSGCFASSFPRKPPSRIVERPVRVRTAVDTCSSCARNRRYAPNVRLLRSGGCSLSVMANVRAKGSPTDVPDNRPLSSRFTGRSFVPRNKRQLAHRPRERWLDQRLLDRGQHPAGHLNDHTGTLITPARSGIAS
jgi:hypothetical protein